MQPRDDKTDYWNRMRRISVLAVIIAAAAFLANFNPEKSDYWNRIHSWIGGPTPTPSATRTPRPTRTPKPTRTPTETPTATATRSPRPTPVYYPNGQLLYVRHETDSRGRGLPDTYQYYEFRFQPAPPGSALRSYLVGVQRLALPYMSAAEFENEMAGFWAGNRALSNGHDYEEDFAIGPVITGGAMVRATGNTMTRAGGNFIEVYALDPQHLPPVPASLAAIDWTLHFRPTIVTPYLRPDGRWQISPFPQLDGWGIAPILGENARQWINAEILQPISAPVGPFDYPPGTP